MTDYTSATTSQMSPTTIAASTNGLRTAYEKRDTHRATGGREPYASHCSRNVLRAAASMSALSHQVGGGAT